eukprot:sb/3472472/
MLISPTYSHNLPDQYREKKGVEEEDDGFISDLYDETVSDPEDATEECFCENSETVHDPEGATEPSEHLQSCYHFWSKALTPGAGDEVVGESDRKVESNEMEDEKGGFKSWSEVLAVFDETVVDPEGATEPEDEKMESSWSALLQEGTATPNVLQQEDTPTIPAVC